MKTTALLIFICILLSLGATAAQKQQVSIVLSGESNEYKSLDDIKPTLVNSTDHSIFLVPDDCGQARLWLHYMNRTWRSSVWPECGSEDVIEVKSGERYEIPALMWRPLVTNDGKTIERKTFPGRYRMMMRFSLTNLNNRPGVPHLRVRESDPNRAAPKTTVSNIIEVTKDFIVVP